MTVLPQELAKLRDTMAGKNFPPSLGLPSIPPMTKADLAIYTSGDAPPYPPPSPSSPPAPRASGSPWVAGLAMLGVAVAGVTVLGKWR
jgi:hypothetical protein